MQAGKLRQVLEIQRKRETNRTDYNEINFVWDTITTVRGFVQPLTAKDLLLTNTVRSEVSHKIYIRYITDLKATDRLFDVTNNCHYSIHGFIDKDSRYREIEILAAQVL